MRKYDYVIVGAGAAGCVLANRLSEDPALEIALLEAGGSHHHPFISMPKGLAKVMQDPSRIFPYASTPEKQTGNQPEFWVRGRVMGGSSAINGMMYVRGQPADFDEIAAKSSQQWSWTHIAQAYRAIESHELGEAGSRGGNGPLHVTLPDRRTRLTEAMIEAGVSMGLPRKEDVNTPDNGEAVGYASRTIYRGKRQSAALAFLDPIRSRPNLTIVSNAIADKILFDDGRATGVRIHHKKDNRVEDIETRGEVIISGGAMATPGILQRSGIGAAGLLERLGIKVVHDSPEVGENLLEHRAIIAQWKLNAPLSENAQFSGWRLLANTARYAMTKSGPMSAAAYEVGAWLKSTPQVPRPDIQFLVAPFSFDFAKQRTALESFPGINVVAYALRPTSRGEIHIASKDPEQMPVLKPHYYSDAHDRQLMIETVRRLREYAAQPPLRQLIAEETFPGHRVVTPDEIIDAYDRAGTCGYHAVGSCRMGADARSVVDPDLRVRGVDGLRVMDTSIMPQIPAGNTNAPTMAMAWRAADVIRQTR